MAVLKTSKRLKKELNLFNVYTLATGATLSSGFFLLPGIAAAEAGPAVVLAYFVAVLPLLPGILSKIELATAMPRAGGEYYFLDRAMGPLVGTVCGLGTWASLVLKAAFALIGIGAYLRLFVDMEPGAAHVQQIAVACAVVLGGVNLFGAKKTGALQTILVIALLGLLAWFTTAGLGSDQFNAQHFDGFLNKGWDQLIAAAGLVCVSYMGLTKVASVAEEVKDPERNLTLGIFLALATALAVYGLGTYVIVGVLPYDALVPPPIDGVAQPPNLTPVASAAEHFVGHSGAVVMTVAAILAFLSVGNAGILSASRYPLAMSRDHLLPTWFRRLNKQKTPVNGVVVTVVAIIIAVTVFDPTKIAKLASAFLLMLFAFNCLAVVVMRESRIASYDPGFRAPWYPWLQVFGIVGPVGMIVAMGWLPVLFSTGLILVGVLWYLRYARVRVSRGGAIFHLFARLGERRFEGLDRELRGILKEKGLRDQDPYDEIVAAADLIDARDDATFSELVHEASVRLAVHVNASADDLTARFMEGTRVGATPVTKGVALPHIRLHGLDRPLMVLARSRPGVFIDVDQAFLDHADDDAIHAVIFLASPEDDPAQHLRLLAQVAPHVDDEHFIPSWLDAEGEQAVKEILLRNERFLSLTLRPHTRCGALIGRRLRDLSLPEGALVALVRRQSEMLIPHGDTRLEDDDRLTIIGEPKAIEHLSESYAVE